MDDYVDDSSTTALLDLSFTDNFGIIDFSGDQDWLRMELAAGTSYEIHVHGQDLGFQLAAPRIRVFDSSNNLIASGDATDGGVVLTFTAFTYGTHFLAIDSADPTDIGTYNFHGFGDDNSGSERLTINSQTQGALEYFADQDSFLVRLVAGIPYTFDLRGQASAGGTLLDPLLLLLNSSGATVASGDDLGLGADSSIQFTPTTSGDYRLAAQSSGANDLGSYTISASAPALGLAIAATDADRAEGNSGSTPFTFTITRSDSLTAAINVAWQVTGTGANPADAADFASAVLDTGPSGNIAFAAGEASKTLTVNVRGDTLVEANESFLVSVSSPANGAATAMGVIRNDDGAPAISIAATTASLLEGSSGAETPYGFTVTRSGDLAAANSVAWAVTGTGANPADAADFTNGVLPSGTISFAVGEASKTLVVNVHGDTQLEPDEGFLVTLSSPTNGAAIGTASASGLIRNDDIVASISIAATTASLNRGVERARRRSGSPSPARATSRRRTPSPGRSPAAVPARPTPPTSPTACCPPARSPSPPARPARRWPSACMATPWSSPTRAFWSRSPVRPTAPSSAPPRPTA